MTDAGGAYNINLPPGTYKLYVSPPSPYVGFWYGGNDFPSATAVQISGNSSVNITLRS
jgi:hypothetical protein